MSKVLYEITVSTGTYTNKDGEEKKRYLKIGSVIDTKNGPMAKFDCIPLAQGGWDGWAWMNPPREEDRPAKKGNPRDIEF